MTRIKWGQRLPSDSNAMAWLWLYADALAGRLGDQWRAAAEQHTPSGRTDGTSWRDWRDEVLAAP